MIELRPLKTMLALAVALIASTAFAQTQPVAMTAPDSTVTTQAVPSDPGSITSSTDPLIQKRIDDKAHSADYKMDKMPPPWRLRVLPWLH